jgi:hypothetical protein
MTRMRLIVTLVLATVVVAGCASGDPAATTDGNDRAGRQEGSKDKSGASATGSKGSGAPKKGSKPGTGSGAGSEGDDGGSKRATGPEGADNDGSAAYVPAAGDYLYDQTGFEEFCDTSSCDKKDLPPTQVVETSHKGSSGDTVTVVTEAKSSERRFTRTTTRYSRSNAEITNVQIHFDYQGFEFDNSYQPDPPVESLRYPLNAGDSWSGTWKDSTSGDYTVSVGSKRSVSVGGATVQAFPVRTVTDFRGEFEGTADITVWIDPATAAVVRIEGNLDVKSTFGSYRSEFEATLHSGPGY